MDRAAANKVQRIFDEANELASRVGGVDYGMNILLGPPIYKPDLMIVSLQGAGADRTVQVTWPERLLYSDPLLDIDPRTGRENKFGRVLRKDFYEAGLTAILEERTTASNIVFPQWPDYAGWRKHGTEAQRWEKMCLDWLRRLLDVLKPALLVTYGKQPFEKLTGAPKLAGVLAEADFQGIPVLGCGHLSRGATREERACCMTRIRQFVG